jgi:hypothetical protein
MIFNKLWQIFVEFRLNNHNVTSSQGIKIRLISAFNAWLLTQPFTAHRTPLQTPKAPRVRLLRRQTRTDLQKYPTQGACIKRSFCYTPREEGPCLLSFPVWSERQSEWGACGCMHPWVDGLPDCERVQGRVAGGAGEGACAATTGGRSIWHRPNRFLSSMHRGDATDPPRRRSFSSWRRRRRRCWRTHAAQAKGVRECPRRCITFLAHTLGRENSQIENENVSVWVRNGHLTVNAIDYGWSVLYVY